jgi:hypothetical protein
MAITTAAARSTAPFLAPIAWGLSFLPMLILSFLAWRFLLSGGTMKCAREEHIVKTT